MHVFIDMCCPFSRKIFRTITTAVQPHYGERVRFVLQLCSQPWHPQSTFLHRALLAVHSAAGSAAAVTFAARLFDVQESYSDDAVANETPVQLQARLAALAIMDDAIGSDAYAAAYPGTHVALKFAVRYGRQQGVHVSPTVFVNGIEATAVSSSWSAAEWQALLDPLL